MHLDLSRNIQTRCLAALFMVAGGLGSRAQEPWARRVGGLSNDGFNGIVVDQQGSSYVTGEFGLVVDAGGGTMLTSQGSLDVNVAKYTTNGDLVWAKRCGGVGLDRGIALALSPDGSLVVVGQFMGTAEFGTEQITSQGGTQDVFVMKMDAGDGDIQWVEQGGSAAGVDQPNGVSVGADGAIAVTGEFRGTATFAMGTITSMPDPDTAEPSVDIFIAAYASDGTGLWLQQGAAEFADRGMAVVHDALGNVYVTGQFSDTLQFDVVHDNAMYSAVFLVCFDPAGNEMWFRAFGGGTYNQVYTLLLSSDDRLLLVGDVQGTVIFLDSEPDLFTAVAPRSSFILDVSLAGELNAQVTWGSEHGLNTRAAAVSANEIAVLGRFECQLTGFSTIYGEGAFLATGQHDLYVARFQAGDLSFKDAQQFGGHREKTPGGISHAPDESLRFCGAFEQLLVFPCGAEFTATPPAQYLQTAGAPSPYCEDPFYGAYRGLRGSALMDGFVCKGYVPDREPYDIFERSGSNCLRGFLDVAIQLNGTGVHGPDSLEHCGPVLLQVDSRTAFAPDTAIRHNAPDVEYTWNGTQVSDTFMVTVSGWYTVASRSLAGCWESADSIHVTVHPIPARPLISDDQGVNTNALVTNTVVVCEPEEPWLWATNLDPANTSVWSGGGNSVANDSILATVSGWYSIRTTTPYGCEEVNEVRVVINPNEPLPPLDAVFDLYYPQDTDLDDTVRICSNIPLGWAASVELMLNGSPTGLPPGILLLYSCDGTGWSQSLDLVVGCSEMITTEGSYSHLLRIALTNAPCGTDTLFFADRDTVYVDPFPVGYPSADISGPTLICPGDTAELVLTCTLCDQISWSGPGIVESWESGALVGAEGNYSVQVERVDTNGCETEAYASHMIDYNPRPLLEYFPADGIICPNATAVIWSDTPAQSYQWFGPLGPMAVDNDSIITSQQGAYYLEIVDLLGCELTSDPVLITDYATPFLNVLPDNVICEPGETVTLQVVTTGAASLAWQSPLSGSAVQQVVDEPGLYTCSVQACGIVTTLTVEVIGSTAEAVLVDPGPFTVCTGTEVQLEAVPGQALYYWLPGPIIAPQITVASSGTYSLVAADAHGCLDTAMVTVTVIPFTQALGVSDQTICIGEPLLFTASGSGSITWYANPDLAVSMGSGTVLDLGVATAVGTTTVYVQQQEDTCTSALRQVSIEVLAPPAMPLITAPDSACAGSMIQVGVMDQPGVQYSWTTPTGAAQGPVVVLDPVTTADAGSYTIVVSNPGCSVIGPAHVLGVVVPELLVIESDTLICPGGIAVFYAPPGFTDALWNGTTSGPVFTTTTAGTVTLQATDTQGCTNSATAVVSVYVFTVPAEVTGASICLGDDAVLQVNGSGSFLWYTSPDLQEVYATGTQIAFDQPVDSAVYFVVQTEEGCSSTPMAVALDVVPLPLNVLLQAPDEVCAGTPLSIGISSGQGALTGSWQTPTGPYVGLTIEVQQSALINGGIYTVVPAIGPCLADTLTARIVVLVPMALDLGADTVFCGGASFVLRVPEGFTSPIWNTGASGAVITTNVPGTYTVNAWDLQGCAVTDAITLDTLACGVFVPNVITPNGDGVNDAWYIDGGGFLHASALIFNRWGQKVYEGDPIGRPFVGKDQNTGEPLPDGTYFYVLSVERALGGTIDLTGHFLLQR